MASSSDGRRRSSGIPVARPVRLALSRGRRLTASSFGLLARFGRAALARSLDPGYRPERGTRSELEDAAIELHELSIRYGRRIAVSELSGRFAPGSLTAIVGPNGAGKSSLLKAIAGLVRPSRGRIRCAALSDRRLAYLPQQAEIDRSFPINVDELVALGAWRDFGAFHAPPPPLVERVAEVIDAVGLARAAALPIAELSAGQLQRALFARLMMQDAAVILLDEPFAAVDERTTEDLLALLHRWHGEGRTIVAVLHDLDMVRSHFPAALLLGRRCLGWGDTASVATPANLVLARQALDPGRNAMSAMDP